MMRQRGVGLLTALAIGTCMLHPAHAAEQAPAASNSAPDVVATDGGGAGEQAPPNLARVAAKTPEPPSRASTAFAHRRQLPETAGPERSSKSAAPAPRQASRPIPAMLPSLVGQPAYAVEEVNCERDGAWATVLEGMVESADAAVVRLTPERRFGFHYHNFAAGIDQTDWYCVPRRRYCFAEVKFTDWSGIHRAGQSGDFPRAATFNRNTRLVVGMAAIIRERCRQ